MFVLLSKETQKQIRKVEHNDNYLSSTKQVPSYNFHRPQMSSQILGLQLGTQEAPFISTRLVKTLVTS